MRQIASAITTPASPLALKYFSQAPYRLGPHCVKYAARPRRWKRPPSTPWQMLPGIRLALGTLALVPSVVRLVPGWNALHNALRDGLVRDLEHGPVEHDFLVQRWPDLANLPVWAIEDATRPWTAPWTRVARIRIARQTEKEISGRDARAERMTFSPWRVGEEHQPPGSISRARLAIYRHMSEFRHRRNAPADTRS